MFLNYPMPIERKLAAIMFTDIAGYTESMSKSESKTLNLLEKKRSILKPLLKEYKGTFVKEIGDGTLSYFESAVNAATCAVKLQEKTYDDKEMNIRVGIHIGDIVFKDGDVFGSGVNVASRLESIAPAGGVCVSKSVYDELSNQDDFDGIDLGLQSLKGVGRLVEVFGLKGDKLNEPDPQKYQENKVAVHSDDEVPSIAIIPFDNKGADEDVFYAYGISADLISDCSGAGLIRVAGLKEVEELGDIPFKEKAEKLFVRYVATGSLWKMDDKFQLNIELYDTKESKVIWADRWHEEWDNLTTIQSNLSDGLLKTLDIKPQLDKKIGATNSEAYEYYLRGFYLFQNRQNKEDLDVSINFLNKSIELDENLIKARHKLAFLHFVIGNINKSYAIYKESLTKSEGLGDKHAIGASKRGLSMIYSIRGEKEKQREYLEYAMNIFKEIDDKNILAVCLHDFGLFHREIAEYEKSIDYFQQCINLRTQVGKTFDVSIMAMAYSYYLMGEIDKSLNCLEEALQSFEKNKNKMRISATCLQLSEIYLNRTDYDNALKYSTLAEKLETELSGSPHAYLWTYVYYFISQKYLGIEYNKTKLYKIIEENKIYSKENKISWYDDDFILLYRLYKLLEDISYLETAYRDIKKKADNLEPDVAAKFLSYPIPKAIVEEWEKVK